MEQVGKVKLDLSVYSGADLYSDGAIEDELLRITKDCSGDEYPSIIENSGNWPVLYHLSPIRENIVRWLPITKKDKVLEVGSGCGAITGALCEMAGEVTSCDLSKRRSMVNAYRNSECDNLTIHVGNFTDVEKALPSDYDYILLIGVFEYGACYIDSKTPYEDFLKLLTNHLKSSGRIVIAIENRIGMKYWAGSREDHTAEWFGSLTGYSAKDGVRTFSKSGLMQIFERLHMEDVHFYYPYPDYKFMKTLYSDRHLPKIGELNDNLRNFDRDRMRLFDENKAFNEMIKDGTFDEYSNSFLVVLGPDTNVDYARFSNDRKKEFCILTKIVQQEASPVVLKSALYKEGDAHIEKLSKSCADLTARYANGSLSVNSCNIIKKDNRPVAEFEYVEGRTLSEIMEDRLDAEDKEGFMALFDEYVKRISAGEGANVSDYDLVFSNILVNDEKWTLIDYEWTVDKDIPVKEAALRSAYCFLLEHPGSNIVSSDSFLERFEALPEYFDYIREDEAKFQKNVTGNRKALAEIRDIIGNSVYDVTKMVSRAATASKASGLQIYRQNPFGSFDEEHSSFVTDAYEDETNASVCVNIGPGENMIRIDPCMESCIVTIKECLINQVEYPVGKRKMITSNGKSIGKDTFIMAGNDPQLVFSLKGMESPEEREFFLSMEVVKVSDMMAQKLCMR